MREALEELLRVQEQEKSEKISQIERRRIELKKKRDQLEWKIKMKEYEDVHLNRFTVRTLRQRLDRYRSEEDKYKQRNDEIRKWILDTSHRLELVRSETSRHETNLHSQKMKYLQYLVSCYPKWKLDREKKQNEKVKAIDKELQKIHERRQEKDNLFQSELRLKEELQSKQQALLIELEKERKQDLLMDLKREQIQFEEAEARKTFEELRNRASSLWEEQQKVLMNQNSANKLSNFKDQLEHTLVVQQPVHEESDDGSNASEDEESAKTSSFYPTPIKERELSNETHKEVKFVEEREQFITRDRRKTSSIGGLMDLWNKHLAISSPRPRAASTERKASKESLELDTDRGDLLVEVGDDTITFMRERDQKEKFSSSTKSGTGDVTHHHHHHHHKSHTPSSKDKEHTPQSIKPSKQDEEDAVSFSRDKSKSSKDKALKTKQKEEEEDVLHFSRDRHSGDKDKSSSTKHTPRTTETVANVATSEKNPHSSKETVSGHHHYHHHHMSKAEKHELHAEYDRMMKEKEKEKIVLPMEEQRMFKHEPESEIKPLETPKSKAVATPESEEFQSTPLFKSEKDEKKQKEAAPVKKSNAPQTSLLSSSNSDDESSEDDEEPSSAYTPSFGSSGPSLQRTKTQSSLPAGVIGGTLSRRGGVLRQQSLQAMMGGGSTSTISFMDDEIESESD